LAVAAASWFDVVPVGLQIPDDDDAGGLAELAQHRARGLAARRATEEQEEGEQAAYCMGYSAEVSCFQGLSTCAD
jgi:hypothetical protein